MFQGLSDSAQKSKKKSSFPPNNGIHEPFIVATTMSSALQRAAVPGAATTVAMATV